MYSLKTICVFVDPCSHVCCSGAPVSFVWLGQRVPQLQVQSGASSMVCFLFASRTSLATFHEGKHNISHMSMDVARGLMVTCGTDRIVKVTCSTVPISSSVQTAPSSCYKRARGIYSPVSPSDWQACLPFYKQPIASR